MILYNDDSKAQAPFQIQFLQPPPLIKPVDYPTGGTSQITVTAYWGTVVMPVLVSISGAASFNASASATDVSNPAYTVVRFAIPIAATRTDGTISVTLQAATGTAGTGPAIQVFKMDVFSTPLVQYSEPTQGGLDGTVPKCNKCILNSDSTTISLWVSNFPYIYPDNFAAVSVTFGSLLCSGIAAPDGRVCTVRSVSTLSDTTTGDLTTYLTVSVPPAAGGIPGSVTVQVQYVTSDTTRSPRIASTTFTYVRLRALFNAASICTKCFSSGSCIRGDLCGDGKAPIIFSNAAPSIRVSMTDGGTMIADIRNFPAMQIDSTTNQLAIPSTCTSVDLCGLSLDPQNVGKIIRVLSSSYSSTRIEAALLPSTLTGTISATLRIKTDPSSTFQSASFTVQYYNSQISLAVAPTQGPAEGGGTVILQVANFIPLDTSTEIYSIMSLTFGGQVAVGVNVVSSSLSATMPGTYTLTVPVPAYTCSSCTYTAGLADVQVLIQSTQDSSQSVTTSYRYISAPVVVAARFESTGTGLSITFDQGTDMAGVATSQIDCGFVIQIGIRTLGNGPSCTWRSPSILAVIFGAGPTIIPGGTLSLVAGRIRSRAGLSNAASSSPFNILSSLTSTRPKPITLKGPEAIDTCSDLQLFVTVPSPRALTYVWQCPDDANYNLLLSSGGFGSSFYISSSTMALPQYTGWLDNKYTFTVYAIDFLGVQSDTASITVIKRDYCFRKAK